MEWIQRARIRLAVDQKYLINWSPEREKQMCEFARREFSVTSDECDIIITIRAPQNVNVEFTALLNTRSVSALVIVEALERLFFDIKISKREVSYEER